MRRRPEPAGPDLSPPEVEVLRPAAEGRANAAIGTAPRISATTVKTHLMRAYEKPGVSDRTAAVSLAGYSRSGRPRAAPMVSQGSLRDFPGRRDSLSLEESGYGGKDERNHPPRGRSRPDAGFRRRP
nr:helix-turn-helix transcriptional regulator [Nocardiopsis alkaliphila]